MEQNEPRADTPSNIIEKEAAGITTNRGIDSYAECFGMNRSDFLRWIGSKKKVLDVGSGGGLLKKEIDILKEKGKFKGNIKVYSFDINYSSPEGNKEALYSTHLAFNNLDVNLDRDLFNKIEKRFKETAVGGTFRNLPYPDGYFDGVLASYSFGVASKDKDQLMSAFREVYRVMDRKDGTGLISVIYDKSNKSLNTGSAETSYSLEDISYLSPKLKKTETTTKDDQKVEQYYIEVKR